MVDLTKQTQEHSYKTTVATMWLELSKKDMLNALTHEQVIISGKVYRTPETQLLQFLLQRKFGQVKLELTLIG